MVSTAGVLRAGGGRSDEREVDRLVTETLTIAEPNGYGHVLAQLDALA